MVKCIIFKLLFSFGKIGSSINVMFKEFNDVINNIIKFIVIIN